MFGWQITTFSGLAIVSMAAISVAVTNQKDATVKGMYTVVTVEGKTFFIERPTIARNWTEAWDHCAQANLRLASITSPWQEALLNHYLVEYNDIKPWSWTAGRSARSLSQFVWDSDPNSTISSNLKLRYLVSDHTTCLAFTATLSAPLWDAYECSLRYLGTLCESIP